VHRDTWGARDGCRRTLRSVGTSRLLVPPVRLSTVGTRAFTVAGTRVWNALPEKTTSAQSLTTSCQHLKTWFFRVISRPHHLSRHLLVSLTV